MVGAPLGVLDFGPLRDAVELAPAAERLGFRRYWITEHQPQPSPVLLASVIASVTDTIRVGTAGVLLHYCSPLRTAHDFHVLERVFPGRIDAGFCGGMTPASLADEDRDELERAALIDRYPERATRFVQHLRNTRADPAFEPSTAWNDVGDDPPQLWAHGGGKRSADLAAALGLAFGYALMFSRTVDRTSAVEHYRRHFVPHPDRERPLVVVAVAGVCAASDQRARELADAYPNKELVPRIVGNPDTCARQLAAYQARYQADEILFSDLCSEFDDRLLCYELLAAGWRHYARMIGG